MGDTNLRQIEERLNEATKGPWTAMIEGENHESGDSFIMTGIKKGENIWSENRGPDLYLSGGTINDLKFIAHAKQDIEYLLNELRKLRREKP